MSEQNVRGKNLTKYCLDQHATQLSRHYKLLFSVRHKDDIDLQCCFRKGKIGVRLPTLTGGRRPKWESDLNIQCENLPQFS